MRIGHTPLSKLWRVLDEKLLPTLHIDPRGFKGLSYGDVQSLSQNDLEDFIQNLNIPNNKITHSSEKADFSNHPNSQFHYISELSKLLPIDAHIYLGNSSIIRDFELAFKKQASFYGNRGANGIDGQIASAIGIAKNLDENLYICLGDLTFEYDWSALRYLAQNCKIIIFNNGGGRIFERIGIQSEIILEHKDNYESIVKTFQLTYSQFNNPDITLDSQIIELIIDHQQTLQCFKELT